MVLLERIPNTSLFTGIIPLSYRMLMWYDSGMIRFEYLELDNAGRKSGKKKPGNIPGFKSILYS
jgi:hypothetical protein